MPTGSGSPAGSAVNTGPVMLVGGDLPDQARYNALGDTVNVAARLQSLAGEGGIAVGPATARQIERRFALEALGDVELKGKSASVPAFRVVAELDVESAAAVTPFVARAGELDDAAARVGRAPRRPRCDRLGARGGRDRQDEARRRGAGRAGRRPLPGRQRGLVCADDSLLAGARAAARLARGRRLRARGARPAGAERRVWRRRWAATPTTSIRSWPRCSACRSSPTEAERVAAAQPRQRPAADGRRARAPPAGAGPRAAALPGVRGSALGRRVDARAAGRAPGPDRGGGDRLRPPLPERARARLLGPGPARASALSAPLSRARAGCARLGGEPAARGRRGRGRAARRGRGRAGGAGGRQPVLPGGSVARPGRARRAAPPERPLRARLRRRPARCSRARPGNAAGAFRPSRSRNPGGSQRRGRDRPHLRAASARAGGAEREPPFGPVGAAASRAGRRGAAASGPRVPLPPRPRPGGRLRDAPRQQAPRAPRPGRPGARAAPPRLPRRGLRPARQALQRGRRGGRRRSSTCSRQAMQRGPSTPTSKRWSTTRRRSASCAAAATRRRRARRSSRSRWRTTSPSTSRRPPVPGRRRSRTQSSRTGSSRRRASGSRSNGLGTSSPATRTSAHDAWFVQHLFRGLVAYRRGARPRPRPRPGVERLRRRPHLPLRARARRPLERRRARQRRRLRLRLAANARGTARVPAGGSQEVEAATALDDAHARDQGARASQLLPLPARRPVDVSLAASTAAKRSATPGATRPASSATAPSCSPSSTSEHALLLASPTWAGPRGNVGRVEVSRSRPRSGEALAAWRAGDADVAARRTTRRSSASRRPSPRPCSELATKYVGYRSDRHPFDNELVRKAFSHAVDRDRHLGGGSMRAARPGKEGCCHRRMPGHSHRISPPYDLELARSLLAEAGYPGGQGLPEIRLAIAEEIRGRSERRP